MTPTLQINNESSWETVAMNEKPDAEEKKYEIGKNKWKSFSVTVFLRVIVKSV